MPRKKKVKAPEVPAVEPKPTAEAIEKSPAYEDILASRKAKEAIEPEAPMPEPEAAPEATHAAQVRKMQPVPEGFRPISVFPAASLRVNQSLDRKTVAIQFDEMYRAIRGGPNSEVELLDIQGFRYEPARRQWERTDFDSPGVNAVTAQRFGTELANRRTGREL